MPTGKQNDLLPVRRDTKELLRRAKGGATFDEALRVLLTRISPEDLAAMVDASQARQRWRREAQARADQRGGPGRSADKQRLVADLAVLGWERWRADGRVERLGPRTYRYRITPGGAPDVPVRIRPGRGLPP